MAIQITQKKLVPLKDYKGPKMNLNSDDKKLIRYYKSRIRILENKILKEHFESTSGNGTLPPEVEHKIRMFQNLIKSFNDEIREIKIESLNAQKANNTKHSANGVVDYLA